MGTGVSPKRIVTEDILCVAISFEGLILQNRTMNIFHNLASKNACKKPFVNLPKTSLSFQIYEKPFVQLRCTHVFAPQTYLKPLDFSDLRKAIRITS